MCVPVARHAGMVLIADAASVGILAPEATFLDAGADRRFIWVHRGLHPVQGWATIYAL
jgi:hypothetical protein